MARFDLFPDINQYRAPLTESERQDKIESVVTLARLGAKYMYTLQEAAGICHMSYDEIQTAVHLYRLDAAHILTTVRVPWWSLAEYLIDPANDIDRYFQQWLDSLPHKSRKQTDLQLKKAG